MGGLQGTQMLYDITQLATHLQISVSNLYAKYILPGIVKETGYLGKTRFWDDDGVRLAAIAISERENVYESLKEEKRKLRLAHALELAEKYKSGMTLEEIGVQEQVTRERVRQLLSMVNISGPDGGARIRSMSATANKATTAFKRREARCQKVYGCSFAELNALTGATKMIRPVGNRLIELYWHHRRQSRLLGFPWLFTLPQYAGLIGDRANLFKRERDSLVLGRKDQKGPFSLENCEVRTLAMNSAWTGGLKKAHEKRKERATKALSLYDQGVSLEDIASTFKCSKMTINNLLSTARRGA